MRWSRTWGRARERILRPLILLGNCKADYKDDPQPDIDPDDVASDDLLERHGFSGDDVGVTATQPVAVEWVTTSTINTMGHRARRTARTRGR